jgi:HK97 gp10 family phage protein
MTIRILAKTQRVNKSRIVMSKYESEVKRIIETGANMVRNTAVKSIQSHQSQGATYGGHTASLPGNPPNSDTGFLASNIFIDKDNDGEGASVESRADYSNALEFGTSKMAARPFMQPALEENRRKIIQMYAKLKARGV